jgi:hypothetical protein
METLTVNVKASDVYSTVASWLLDSEYGVSRGNGEYDWLWWLCRRCRHLYSMRFQITVGCTFFFYSSNILQELGSQGYSGSKAGIFRRFGRGQRLRCDYRGNIRRVTYHDSVLQGACSSKLTVLGRTTTQQFPPLLCLSVPSLVMSPAMRFSGPHCRRLFPI